MGLNKASELARQRYRLNYWTRDQENWFDQKEAWKQHPVIDRTGEFKLGEEE